MRSHRCLKSGWWRWCHVQTSESSPCRWLQLWVYSRNRGGWLHSPGGLRCSVAEEVWPPIRTEVCLWGSSISSCRVWYSSPECWVQFCGGDCDECCAEINKQHSDVGIVIFTVCEDWVEGRGDGILCGSVWFCMQTGEEQLWLRLSTKHHWCKYRVCLPSSYWSLVFFRRGTRSSAIGWLLATS